MEEIIRLHNYFNPNLLYVKDSSIIEYDIQSAGFSVLKHKGFLTEKEISDIEKLPKLERNIKIGLLQKQNPNFTKEILDTLSDVRSEFCKINQIEPKNILSIKKDSMVLVNKPARNLKVFDHFNFINKGSFTSYLRVEKYEFYLNSITKAFIVKGFGNLENVPSIIKLIIDTMYKIEPLNKAESYKHLQKLQNNYLSYNMDKEIYREFYSKKFLLKDVDLLLDEIDDVNRLDISYNYMNLLRGAIINMIN